MRRPALQAMVALVVLFTAGCLGSGSDGDVGPSSSSSSSSSACGALDESTNAEHSPGLAQRAAADTTEGGNRTFRWDLTVEDACQDANATVALQATTTEPPQGCPDPVLRASVTSGTTEHEIPLSSAGGVMAGQDTVRPGRGDLQGGNGSFVLSLSATLESTGFAPQDEQCLDGSLQSFTLQASFRRASQGRSVG